MIGIGYDVCTYCIVNAVAVVDARWRGILRWGYIVYDAYALVAAVAV